MPGRLSSLLSITCLSDFIRLFKYIKPYRKGMFLAVFTGALSHFAGIGGSAMGAYLVSVAATGAKKAEDLTPLIIMLGCLVAVKAVMHYALCRYVDCS